MATFDIRALRPMLAAKAQPQDVLFPAIVSPKLDGIRALVVNATVISRSGKPIPNTEVQEKFGRHELDGCDGELVVGDMCDADVFNRTTRVVMSKALPATNVTFNVFDLVREATPYKTRHQELCAKISGIEDVYDVPTCQVDSFDELTEYIDKCLALGYEGVVARVLSGHDYYKHGRSTLSEGLLLKIKEMEDDEAEIVGFDAKMHNDNEATVSELGYTKRSTKKANKVPVPILGAFRVYHKDFGEFGIGTGFTEAQAKEFWARRHELKGKFIKFRFAPYGMKNKPRFPSFIGFRDPIDM